MPELILHHYELSPFSEKIRRLIGYTGIEWSSVITSPMLPRPWLMPLTGGYRRIPVAQVGADVYCDTRLIARKIAAQANHLELYPQEYGEDIEELAEWADTELFKLSIGAAAGPKAMNTIRQHFGWWQIARFMVDRYKLAKGSALAGMKPKQARALFKETLPNLERRVQYPFAFGAKPTIADFSLYHPLWFVNNIGQSRELEGYPKLTEWFHRINGFDKEAKQTLTAEQAYQRAQQGQPLQYDTDASTHDHDYLNRTVNIVPSDYGFIPVEGKLIFADRNERVVRIDHPKLNALNVHLPRVGFEMTSG